MRPTEHMEIYIMKHTNLLINQITYNLKMLAIGNRRYNSKAFLYNNVIGRHIASEKNMVLSELKDHAHFNKVNELSKNTIGHYLTELF